MTKSNHGKILTLAAITALLLTGAIPADPIDRLVAQLSCDPMWENGAYPIIDLPATASTQQVVAKYISMSGFPVRTSKSYDILKIEKVHIKGSMPDLCTAVLIRMDQMGDQVVLVKWIEGHPGSWSTRMYGANVPEAK